MASDDDIENLAEQLLARRWDISGPIRDSTDSLRSAVAEVMTTIRMEVRAAIPVDAEVSAHTMTFPLSDVRGVSRLPSIVTL